MLWRILPHATACTASQRLILLDLRQDRYFLVPVALHEATFAWLTLRHSSAPPNEVEKLLSRSKILREGDDGPTNMLRERVRIPDTIPALDRASEQAPNRARVGHKVALTWLKLRAVPLYRILSARAARSPLPVPVDTIQIMTLAGDFERSRPFAPFARNCLLDSLALDAWLAARGVGTQLVFGVATEPFAAHCWLQTPGAILNDSYDHVSRFTPIFAQ